MLYKTSNDYSKNENDSVNSAVQNNFASSVCVSVNPRCNHAWRCGTRLNCWRNVRNQRKNMGVVVKNIVFYKTNGRRMTGIAQILSSTLDTFSVCRVGQKRLHQLLFTLYLRAMRSKLVSAALLIILWSSVQVTHALPFIRIY